MRYFSFLQQWCHFCWLQGRKDYSCLRFLRTPNNCKSAASKISQRLPLTVFIYLTRPALATAKLGWVKRFGRSKPPWCADCTTISVPHISIGFATTLWNSLWNQWEQSKVKLFLERIHLTKWGTEGLNCHVFHLPCVVHTIAYPKAE